MQQNDIPAKLLRLSTKRPLRRYTVQHFLRSGFH